MSEPYQLTPPDPRKLPPNAGAGRPRGAKNRTSKICWRIAQINTPDIIRRVCVAAIAGDMKAADIILRRTWPEPRGAPIAVNIAQLGGAQLIEAVEAGELTPADAAALMRARSQTIDVSSAGALPAADAREELAKRLVRAIAQRGGEQETAPAEAVDAGDADEIELTEADLAELKDAVSAQVMESLRKRGYGE